jgi:DNA-directed RNA polymerase specialized sigma24 family protein
MHAVAKPVKIEGSVLETLYLAHAPDAVRLAYLLTGDRGLAEDLVHDAFVKAPDASCTFATRERSPGISVGAS